MRLFQAFVRHQVAQAVDTLIRSFDYYAQVGDIQSAMTVARYLFLPVLGIAQDWYSSLPVVLPWYRLLESKGVMQPHTYWWTRETDTS